MTRPLSEKAAEKQALRQKFLSLRNALTEEEVERKSRQILQRLTAHPIYRDCACLYTYVDFRKEVRTGPLIVRALEEGKRVAVPKTAGKRITFYYIKDPEELLPGRFGILEPASFCEEAAEEEALLILPGVAFDRSGGRLGYGGGFYDRYLAAHPGHNPAALAYDLQIAAGIPAEPFDLRVPRIFTESALINV